MPRRGAARCLSATTAKMDAMPVITDPLIADLDDEQREAVLAPRGPVCVLAGAGTALMIHANSDNFANIPSRYAQSDGTTGPDADTMATGDAGKRVACGVITG